MGAKGFDASERDQASDGATAPGSLVEIHAVPHRLLAHVSGRVLLTDVRTHHAWLIQDVDGSLQLPTDDRFREMLRIGEARPVAGLGFDSTPTEKLRFEIDLLDAHDIRQGEKAIWQFLAKAWTPDLIERFGPHDDPWRIRRWRAALRKAVDGRSARGARQPLPAAGFASAGGARTSTTACVAIAVGSASSAPSKRCEFRNRP